MGKLYDSLTPELTGWIQAQKMFFVATSPLAAEGHVNCSPKGLDSLRILGPRRVAYLDLTGSGAETIAHVRENGRIVFMFCAFSGEPKILRLHGRAQVVTKDSALWPELSAQFPSFAAPRSIIVADLHRIGDACGYAVPNLEFFEDRDVLENYSRNKGPEAMQAYRQTKNTQSIDGLPALGVNEA
jgi:Pyridoxamine 5'-phosphate oxidase